MATRLTFLCASATASSRIGAFAAPAEPLDDGGARKAAAFRLQGPRPDFVFTSPSLAAIETAKAIGIDASIEPKVADIRFGEWSGRTLQEVEHLTAAALMTWLADPVMATPGGEAMTELVSRVGAWMNLHVVASQSLLVISHAAVMRAAIAHALSAPIASIMRVDVAPLSTLEFSFNDQWRLQELGRAR